MGGLLTGGSILAAFFGGAIALFSPCCIVFLLPSYLAGAVKNRRWRLLPLTLFFALGIGLVLLPVTLGVALVASTLNRFHVPLYVGGGLLLIALGVLAFLGKSWSMPSFVRAPAVERNDAGGMFALGLFAGVASSCCAPVLAGVMTLSALSSSLVGSATLGITYVFGMTFPLFITALLWDRWNLGERKLFRGRPVRLSVLGRKVATSTTNIAVAVVFSLMGVFVLYLAGTGDTTTSPGFMLALGRWLNSAAEGILRVVDPVPEPVLGLALLALVLVLVRAGLRGRPEPQPEGGSCHDHDHQEAAEGPEGAQGGPDAEAPAAVRAP